MTKNHRAIINALKLAKGGLIATRRSDEWSD